MTAAVGTNVVVRRGAYQITICVSSSTDCDERLATSTAGVNYESLLTRNSTQLRKDIKVKAAANS